MSFKFVPASQHQPEAISSVHIDCIRWHHRKIPLSRGGHMIGRYSPGPGRTLIPFESQAERKAIAHFDALPGVHLILSQPFSIDFRLDGARRRYTPDLLIIADPVPPELARCGFGSLTVLEVKAIIDPYSRAVLDFKLQLVSRATGLPAMAAVSTASTAQEVRHAS